MSRLLHIKTFGGEDHSGSTPDKGVTSADVMKDRIINPRGRLSRRPGYADITDENNGRAFGHITPIASRFILNNIVNTAGGGTYLEAYNSHGRNCSVVGVNGSNTYEFQGVVTLSNAGAIVFQIYRGLREDGEVTWSGVLSNALGTISAGPTLDLGATVGAASQDWIDYSMVIDGTSIYVAITIRNDTASGTTYKSTVKVVKITDIFATGSWALVDSALIDVDDADEFVPFGIDMAIDGEGKLHVIVPYYGNFEGADEYHMKYFQSVADKTSFGSAVILRSAGDPHAPSIVAVPGGDGTENIYISWTEDAGTDLVKFRSFTADSSPTAGLGSPTSLATSPQLDGNYSWCRAILAIDTGGDLHFLYRTATQNLYHSRYSGSAEDAKIVVSDAENFRKLSNKAYDVNTNNLPASQYHCWDMVVKDGFACIFLVDDEDPTVLRRVVRKNSGSFMFGEQIEVLTLYHGFINVRRVYEAFRPLCLMYIHTVGTVRDFKYSRVGIERDQASFTIEAMHEWEMQRTSITDGEITDEAPIQTIILQCSDNYFRLFNEELMQMPWCPGTRYGVGNDEDEYWKRLDFTVALGGIGTGLTLPDPVVRGRFTDLQGNVRCGIGTDQYRSGIWFGQVRRWMLTNDGEDMYNLGAGNMIDVQPLQAPSSYNAKTAVNLAASGANNVIDAGFTFISDQNPLGNVIDDVGGNPSTTMSKKFSNFARYSEDRGLHEKFHIPEEMLDTDKAELFKDIMQRADVFYIKMFYCGISFIYDNRQESQMYILGGSKVGDLFNPDNTADGREWDLSALNTIMPTNIQWAGVVTDPEGDNLREIHPYLAVQLQLRKWNDVSEATERRTNPRVTAVRIWLGEFLASGQKVEETPFYPVKEVVVSKDKEFKDEIENGEAEWTFDDPQYRQIVPIDLADWLAGLESGEYRQINDHGMMEFKYEADKGLLESPFPEAYTVSEVVGDQHIIGNVRIDGTNHPDWIMFPAIRSEAGFANKMNDVYPHAMPMGFTVQGIVALDERTIGVFGAGGEIVKVDVLERAILDRVGGRRGTPYPESVARIGNNALALMDDKIWNWDGVHEPQSIADAIENDSDQEASTYQGLTNIDKTEVWTFDLPAHQWTLFIFPNESDTSTFMFVFDQKRKAWYRWDFYNTFACGCTGLDGELYFSNGYKIFRFPSGTDDDGYEIEDLWMPSSTQLPEGFVAVLDRLYLKYKLTGTTGAKMRVATVRDRGDLAAVNNDFDLRSLIPRLDQRYPFGTKVTDELGLKVTTITQDAIISDIEEVIVEGTILDDVR